MSAVPDARSRWWRWPWAVGRWRWSCNRGEYRAGARCSCNRRRRSCWPIACRARRERPARPRRSIADSYARVGNRCTASWWWGICAGRSFSEFTHAQRRGNHATRRPRPRHAQLGAIVRVRNGDGPTGRRRRARIVVRRDKRDGIRSGDTSSTRGAGGGAACGADRT